MKNEWQIRTRKVSLSVHGEDWVAHGWIQLSSGNVTADYWPLEKPGMDMLQTRHVIGRYTVELHERTCAPLVLWLCLDRANHRHIDIDFWLQFTSLTFMTEFMENVFERDKRRNKFYTDVCLYVCIFVNRWCKIQSNSL